ncbi:MAG: hypothetical protein QXQ81_06525, partial [Candidatus Thorarchaeota archaeon]
MNNSDESIDVDEVFAEILSAGSKMTTRRRRIPRRLKGIIAGGMFLGWLAFVALWLFFVAPTWGSFMDNLAVALSSLFIFSGAVSVMFISGPVNKNRTRLSVIVFVALLVFLTLWFPLASALYGFYQNAAIVFGAVMVAFTIVGVAWISGSPLMVSRFRRASILSVLVTVLWTVSVLVWLWFYAYYLTGYQNVALAFVATIAIVYLVLGVNYFSISRDVRPSSVFGLGLFTLWLVAMALWFWFFADIFAL